MLTKQNYIEAFSVLGFVRETASRTDGSHIRFHHPKYPHLYVGITDHKNTKEMNKTVHKEILKALATYVWFETKNENNFIDFDKAKELLKRVDGELIQSIIKMLKKANGKDVSGIIPQRLHDEISKLYDNVSSEEISLYIQ